MSNIDILIHDPTNRLVCVIENKIRAAERLGQLDKYWQVVEQEFPNYQTIFIYLTPEGREPIDDSHNAYIPFNYDSIAELVDSLCQTQEFTTKSEPQILITHYVKMLRRHIVSDSETAELCQKIWQRHRKALEIIIEHRPNLPSDLVEILASLVKQAKELNLDSEWYSDKVIIFTNNEWNNFFPQIFEAQGWSEDAYPSYFFEFDNRPDQLWLILFIGSGHEIMLQAIHEFAREHPQIFQRVGKRIRLKWTPIYKRQFLTSSDYENVDVEILTEKVQAEWNKFLTQDLPDIRQALTKIQWPDPPALTAMEDATQ